LRQELLEQKRMNQALQRALDERQLAADNGRQRAQSEQVREDCRATFSESCSLGKGGKPTAPANGGIRGAAAEAAR